ncbi:hypothetical protein D9619_006615 [Psilocybe cf. subviscida]|uniref:C2H2-type domain-containing protein n=1 Tax=Psilocybe cf. subviscida TaxID=2480587 RepID=A0A8H5B4S3_9AGAR|nr:hypothetical protein D9619_006615 [Psilocybe cf. subviscida]
MISSSPLLIQCSISCHPPGLFFKTYTAYSSPISSSHFRTPFVSSTFWTVSMDRGAASTLLTTSHEFKGPSGEQKIMSKTDRDINTKSGNDDSLAGTWDRPYVTMDWTSSRPFSYDYGCEKKMSAIHSPGPDSLAVYSRTNDQLLYPNDSPTFDIFGGVNPVGLALSPAASHEESQWHMFLSASLSNPLDSLGLPVFQNATQELLFGTDAQNNSNPPKNLSDELTLGNLRGFENTIRPPLDSLDSLPFSPSSSQVTGHTSVLRPATSPYGSNVGVDCFLLREANQSIIEREMSSSEKYASLLGITPSSSFGLGRSSFPSFSIAPSAFRPTDNLPNVPASKTGRGLTGWSGDHATTLPITLKLGNSNEQKTRLNPSPTFPSARIESVLSTRAATESFGKSEETVQSKQSNSSLSRNLTYDIESEEDDAGDGNDSDDYCPSRSPSAEPSFPSLPSELMNETGPPSSLAAKKKSRRGKGKARGSAALALAVVTQFGARSREGSEALDDLDLLLTNRDGKPSVRKRKNHPIPLPVPVPNLNKKSRGRKVPFVDYSVSSPSVTGSQSSHESSKGGSTSPGGDSQGSGGRTRRKTSRMQTSVGEEIAGSRTYVCVVAGCGKCFVRGEHLKRHVRSIHTYDKPHPCPYEGCDKSFSRRDNLGQHVRIHLQP